MLTKTKINLDIVLPEVRDERDECVQRIIRTLEDKKGIEKVHVVPKDGKEKARLCFHYDPYFISISKVEELAKNAGAEITRRYGHLLIETAGIREPRHARTIQAGIKEQKVIQTVSVSGTGFIQLEFDREATSAETVIEQLKQAGLKIDNVEDFHLHADNQIASPKEKHGGDGHDHQAEEDARHVGLCAFSGLVQEFYDALRTRCQYYGGSRTFQVGRRARVSARTERTDLDSPSRL
jgi:Cd2+/Zn2+-exporting ATPase